LVLAITIAIASVAAVNLDKDLDKISTFLRGRGTTDDAASNLELLRSHKDQIGGLTIHLLLEMADGENCDGRRVVGNIRRYLERSEDSNMGNLLRYISRVYLERCKSDYEHKLEKAFSELSVKRRQKFLGLLSDEFVERYEQNNAPIVNDLGVNTQPGELLNNSVPLLVEYMRSKAPNLDLKKRTHVAKASLLVAKPLAKGCVVYSAKASPLMEEMRNLVSILGGPETNGVLMNSKSFRYNVFRYKYCEEFTRLRKSRKWRAKINAITRSLNMEGLVPTRHKRDPMVIALVAVVAIVGAFVIFYLFLRIVAGTSEGFTAVAPLG